MMLRQALIRKFNDGSYVEIMFMPNLLPPAGPRLPDPQGVDLSDPSALREYLTMLTSAISKHLGQRPPPTQATQGALVQSPNGSTFRIKVADDGTLTAQPFGSAQDQPVPAS
jgi:hypothetical protein